MIYKKESDGLKQQEVNRYSWLFFDIKRPWLIGLGVTLLVIGVSGAFFWWYNNYGDDPAPDGNIGLSYAIVGLTFVVLAGTAYTLRRRFYEKSLGGLNRALNWHVFFALIGLAMLLMHPFGNFSELSSGTVALASMIALVVSGFVGRVLDRLLPWRMAMETEKILTTEGEEQLEVIFQEVRVRTSQKLPALRPSSFPPSSDQPLVRRVRLPSSEQRNTSWDTAYNSLPQKNWEKQANTAAILHKEEQIAKLDELKQAIQREQRYRSIITFWRKLHIALALLTLVLTVWHITTEMPVLLSHLF